MKKIPLSNKKIIEHGDFQTPQELAHQICQFLLAQGTNPTSMLEPTCGLGSLFESALDHFPSINRAIGVDISEIYIETLKTSLREKINNANVEVFQGDFFHTDWSSQLADLSYPLLLIGNPPWVTNSQLGSLRSTNIPLKSNFQNHSGFEAMTGKSNFDISEWMLIQFLHWLDKKEATMAMLCKTSVARKILKYAWKNDITIHNPKIIPIDAKFYFNAAVDACLFACDFSLFSGEQKCNVLRALDDDAIISSISFQNEKIIANSDLYLRWKHIQSRHSSGWRSGVKHDCSKIMELRKIGNQYFNGLDESVNIEDRFVFPLLKSSDVFEKKPSSTPRRYLLVTQKKIGEETQSIKYLAPKTWSYLEEHLSFFEKRGSSIYKGKPLFSIFGVGDYSFSPWKVVISGLYKQLKFKAVGCYEGKPFIPDDTINFLPCNSQEEAICIADILNSPISKEFFEAFIFWDAKRPITIEILNRLDILALSKEVGLNLSNHSSLKSSNPNQLSLLNEV